MTPPETAQAVLDWRAILTDILKAVLVAALPTVLLMARGLISSGGKLLQAQIARVDNDLLRQAMSELEGHAQTAVLDQLQRVVLPAKELHDDAGVGKLLAETGQQAKSAALAYTVNTLSGAARDMIESKLGAGSVRTIADKTIEAAIARTKLVGGGPAIAVAKALANGTAARAAAVSTTGPEAVPHP